MAAYLKVKGRNEYFSGYNNNQEPIFTEIRKEAFELPEEEESLITLSTIQGFIQQKFSITTVVMTDINLSGDISKSDEDALNYIDEEDNDYYSDHYNIEDD